MRLIRQKNDFRNLLESDVRRPLLLSQPEQTDSLSLTQSDPCVLISIVKFDVSSIVMLLSLPA